MKKKRWLANSFKQKTNISKQNSKTVVINNFENLGKKKLSISKLAPIFGKNVKNIVIIGANAYCLACQLKKTQVFTISIKNLEF